MAKVANLLDLSFSSCLATRTERGLERQYNREGPCTGPSEGPCVGERSPSPQASLSLSRPAGVGRPSRKPAGEGRHNPSGTSAGHLSVYAERRSGSAAGESALSLQKDALVRRAASHPNAKPRSTIKSFRATDCTGQTTARTGLPAEVIRWRRPQAVFCRPAEAKGLDALRFEGFCLVGTDI